jgi:hypothetical protein
MEMSKHGAGEKQAVCLSPVVQSRDKSVRVNGNVSFVVYENS